MVSRDTDWFGHLLSNTRALFGLTLLPRGSRQNYGAEARPRHARPSGDHQPTFGSAIIELCRKHFTMASDLHGPSARPRRAGMSPRTEP